MTEIVIGGGFTTLLAILFIALKLTETINWSWLWVLSPLWIPIAIVMIVLMVVFLFAAIIAIWGY